jgi:hypothetical protein
MMDCKKVSNNIEKMFVSINDETKISIEGERIQIPLFSDEEKRFLRGESLSSVRDKAPQCIHGKKCRKGCISIYPTNDGDISQKSAVLASMTYNKAIYESEKYNNKIINDVDSHLRRKFVRHKDHATMFLPITFDTLFLNTVSGDFWTEIPDNDREMKYFMYDITVNLIQKYHDTLRETNVHDRIVKAFEKHAIAVEGEITPVVHFTPSYDLVGGCPSAKLFTDIITIGTKKYPFAYYLPNLDEEGNYDIGFLGEIHSHLYENFESAVLLQVLTPDGSWKKSGWNNKIEYRLYADIQFGVTAKGAVNLNDFKKFRNASKGFKKLRSAEKDIAIANAAVRELFEESDGLFSCAKEDLIPTMLWGNISLHMIYV